MSFLLLHPKIQEFINTNLEKNISSLALEKNPFPEVSWIAILDQILAKKKAKEKLPTWFQSKFILFPSKIAIEQTSSEKTALYKSSLISGEILIDLTGGFGVDDYYFSKKVKSVIHCEINTELSEIVAHNFEKLNIKNIQCYQGDSKEILLEIDKEFDWIYIDPSRRNDEKGKVFMLKDCLPNVPKLLEFYLKYSKNILVKTAPILDISAGLLELKNVKEIHIIAVENEVKEMVWVLCKDYNEEILIQTANIEKSRISKFDFYLNDNIHQPTFSLPKLYLYEPNAAIMKSGGFDIVSSKFNIDKIHQHSHLYTSNDLIDFPGRIFEIENTNPYSKVTMKKFFENQKANITIRNFPESVESIRKKWKIKDGGNRYCFFTTDINNNKIILICTKLKVS